MTSGGTGHTGFNHEHLSMLQTIKEACDLGPDTVYLVEGSLTHKNVWTIDEKLYSPDERRVMGDLIRWDYCKWAGFLAGSLACKITEEGRAQLAGQEA